MHFDNLLKLHSVSAASIDADVDNQGFLKNDFFASCVIEQQYATGLHVCGVALGMCISDSIYQENQFELDLQCWEQLGSKSVYSCHQGIKISCGNSPGTWKHNAEEVWQALQWLKAYHGIPCLLHGILDPWRHLRSEA